MAKTPEELKTLKEKVKALTDELRALSEDELRQIAGGDGESDCKNYKCPRCGCTSWRLNGTTYTCNGCGYKIHIDPS